MSTNRSKEFKRLAITRLAPNWVSGFLLSGVLIGALGSLLVVWHYHIDTYPEVVGLHFLVLNVGYLLGAVGAERLAERVPIRSISLVACAVGCGSLFALSFVAPPFWMWGRLFVLAFVGAAAGLLITALLYGVEPLNGQVPAVAVNLAGMMFGLGCLLAAMISAITYYAGSVRIPTELLAVIPAIYFVFFLLNRNSANRQRALSQTTARESLSKLWSVAGVLFSILLFVQFGNEWAIAGWLPLFLIHRLGVNPESAILALALFFGALMLGRLLAQALLPRMPHRRMLIGSIVLAMLGYLALSFTDSLAGALTAIVVVGAGFAPIYPLVVEKLDDRFAFQPRVYNGIFAMAITGGMSEPWLLGYVAGGIGMRYVMLVPALGSIVVLVLALLIMLEAYLMGANDRSPAEKPLTKAAGQ